MPRSCNYSNIERIKEQARYDEEKNVYHLPEPTREEVQFPQMGNLPGPTTNGRPIHNNSRSQAATTDYEDDFIVPDDYQEENEKSYTQNPSPLPEKTRIKRQEQLLNENLVLQRAKRPLQMTENDYMNRRLNPYDAPARLSRKYGFSSDKQ